MTIINSISGIRGTIGGKAGEALTPFDVLKFAGAYGAWLKACSGDQRVKVIVGRDGRISGPVISNLVVATLQLLGIDVIEAGITTTPAIAMGVGFYQTQGGIILTASHNPKNWNALKLLNGFGEFLTDEQASEMQEYCEIEKLEFVPVEKIGRHELVLDLDQKHVDSILALPLVDADAVRKANFTVAVDGINSSGGIAVPLLLEALGVKDIHKINCQPNGMFSHNPEPLAENLGELSQEVISKNAHLGIAVDPDVDRLALVCEDGEMFGEEYTLVAVADYVLSNTAGNTVSNLSSSQALADVTKAYGQQYFSSAVGEVNVVAVMKKHNAVIGGEGNGGVIFPELHYGRDALVGIALFLTHLAKFGKSCSHLKKKYPEYHMAKKKLETSPETNLDLIFDGIEKKYHKYSINKVDGIKVVFDDSQWVHMRKSNTEPIIRIYCESDSMAKANTLCNKIIDDIREMLKEQG